MLQIGFDGFRLPPAWQSAGKGRDRRRSWVLQAAGIALLTLLPIGERAAALTVEQAREQCRESVGRPIVQSCMRGQGGRGDLEACRASASPRVRACIEKALNAAHGRANVPVAVPKDVTAGTVQAGALPTEFVAPPRTITDITAILDQEKPDPKKIEALKAEANATPSGRSADELARAYYNRGAARASLGRVSEALADANKALEVARGGIDLNLLGRLQQFAGLQYLATGNPRQALAVFSDQIRQMNAPGGKGYLFGGNVQIAAILIQMGDIAQAEGYLRRSVALITEARTSGRPGWRTSYAARGQSWEADVENHKAMIFEARGRFQEAEASYRLAEQRRRGSLKTLQSLPNPPPPGQVLRAADGMVLAQARMKARQGRLAEAEAEARRALLARLKDQGKYNAATPRFITGLADILVEQGRYEEAEKLARVAIEINRTIGIAEDSQSSAQLLSHLAGILHLQRKPGEAAKIYAELDAAIAKWDPQRRQALDLNSSRIQSLFASGQVEAGIVAAQALLKRETARVGDKHFLTAAARGTLAIGLARAGKDADAMHEFKTALPILIAAARENADDDDSTVVVARRERLQDIVEVYMSLLARKQADAAIETFRLADAVRGHSVQRALAAASMRMTSLTKDPALAELVRREQDLSKQVNALLGTLNNVLSLPAAERDDKGVKELYATIDLARADREKARAEIGRRFPSYAELADPKSPGFDDIQNMLRPDEAMLSFYLGREASFVWAISKEGPVAFAAVPATAQDFEQKVKLLRESLEPRTETIDGIPAFDLATAHEVYRLLLHPVRSGWQRAKSLIVVSNGALGLLPIGLLPTAPHQIDAQAQPAFTAYRGVPWLARSHAVTMVPSAAALRTLRQLPAGSDKRETLIGFGDPLFSREQASAAPAAADAPAQVAAFDGLRGLPLRRRASPSIQGVDSAELALLPRLPDTADELKSIALALEADPAKVLHLGKEANERTVKSADLSRYRIVAFATHGLVPGELNGLTQPALALSAPDVADVDGDGLLTMGEILALKLDADWVILSACNTGTGAGAGAEAFSGLGRAFFYAGSRALLVTNWSVHSASARDLVTDLFRRQAADPKITRAEALRQAMLALMDGPGATDAAGKTLFSYAHPLFWAPFTILGDGAGG